MNNWKIKFRCKVNEYENEGDRKENSVGEQAAVEQPAN